MVTWPDLDPDLCLASSEGHLVFLTYGRVVDERRQTAICRLSLEDNDLETYSFTFGLICVLVKYNFVFYNSPF